MSPPRLTPTGLRRSHSPSLACSTNNPAISIGKGHSNRYGVSKSTDSDANVPSKPNVGVGIPATRSNACNESAGVPSERSQTGFSLNGHDLAKRLHDLADKGLTKVSCGGHAVSSRVLVLILQSTSKPHASAESPLPTTTQSWKTDLAHALWHGPFPKLPIGEPSPPPFNREVPIKINPYPPHPAKAFATKALTRGRNTLVDMPRKLTRPYTRVRASVKRGIMRKYKRSLSRLYIEKEQKKKEDIVFGDDGGALNVWYNSMTLSAR